MQVEFTADQETRLETLAGNRGMDARELVKDAALRMLHDELSFLEGVDRGIEAADRGEFLESSEVWARVEAIVRA